jgi:hypothetical protein
VVPIAVVVYVHLRTHCTTQSNTQNNALNANLTSVHAFTVESTDDTC